MTMLRTEEMNSYSILQIGNLLHTPNYEIVL